MSKEQRVVEMRFDNKQFEKNAQETLDTLDKLKKSTQFESSASGFEKITAAAKKVSLAPLETAVGTLEKRFSAMEIIATTALVNIANSATNAAKKAISALTIKPVTTGFNEYELKMNSVQTIMASTGESLEKVNGYLEELNKYSDQTIYSFSDMTQNIGKFTNAGVSLDKAVLAIKGVSNEAAISGANANEASRAMYNFAQALSAGYVKLIDWKSIENANMATKQFKEELIKTAVEVGTLTDLNNGYYNTVKNKSINATANFNDSLQDQWMTTEVLIKTLSKYADETTEIGKAATAAASDIKTATQLWGVLEETAQSGWAQTWEILIGDFDVAKKLFTSINNVLSPMIDKMSDTRNEALRVWKAMGGLSDVLESFKTIGSAVKTFFQAFSDGFKRVFDRTGFGTLVQISEGLKEIAKLFEAAKKAMDSNADVMENFRTAAQGVASVLSLIKDIVTGLVGGAFTTFVGLVGIFVGDVSSLSGGIGQVLIDFTNWVKESKILTNAIRLVVSVVLLLAVAIYNVIHSIMEFPLVQDILSGLGEILLTVFQALWEWGGKVVNAISSFIDRVREFSNSGATTLETITFAIKDFLKNVLGDILNVGGVFTWLGDNLSLVFSGIKTGATGVWEVLKAVSSGLYDFASSVLSWVKENIGFAEIFAGIITAITVAVSVAIYKLMKVITGLISDLRNLVHSITSVIKGFASILKGIGNVLNGFASKLNSQAMINYAIAVGILTAALVAIALLVPLDKLWETIAVIGALMGILIAAEAVTILLTKFAAGAKQALGSIAVLMGLGIAILEFLEAFREIIEILDSGLRLQKALVAVSLMALLIVGLLDAVHLLNKEKVSFKRGVANALMLAGFGYGIRVMIDTFEGINVDKSLPGKMVIFGTVLYGTIKLVQAVAGANSNISKAGSAIIKMAIGLAAMALVFKLINALDINYTWDNLAKLTIIVSSVAGLMFIAGQAGDNVSKAGGALIKIAVAMGLMTLVVKLIDALEFNDISKDLIIVGALGTLIAGLIVASKLAGEFAGRSALMLIAAAGAIAVLTAAIVILSHVDKDSLVVPALVVGGLLAVMSLLLAASSKVGMFNETVTSIAIAIGVMSAAFVGMSFLPWDNILRGIAAMAAVIVSLIAVFLSAKMIDEISIDMKSMAKKLGIMLGAVSIISGIIVGLSFISNPTGAAIAMGAVAGALIAVAGAMKLIEKVDVSADLTSTLKYMLAALLGVGAIIAVMSYFDMSAKTLFVAASMSTLLLALAASLKIVNRIQINSKLVKTMAQLALIVSGLALVMNLIAEIPSDFGRLIEVTVAMSGVILALAGAIKIIKGVNVKEGTVSAIQSMVPIVMEVALIIGLIAMIPGDFNVTIEAATSMSAVIIALAAAIKIMNGVNVKAGAVKAIQKMSAVVLEVGVIFGILSKFGSAHVTIEAATSMSAVIIALGTAMKIMNGVKVDNGIVKTMSKMAVIVGVVGVVIGLISKLPGNFHVSTEAAASMGIILVALATSLRVMNNVTINNSVNDSLWKMAAIVGIIGTIIGLIAKLPGDLTSTIEAAGSISLILITMSTAIKIMDGVMIQDSAIESLNKMLLAVGIVSAIVVVISAFDLTGRTLEIATSIGILLTSMAAAMRIIDDVKVSGNAIGTMYALSGVVAIIAIIVGIIAKLSIDGHTLEMAASISVLLIALAAAANILGKFNGSFVGGLEAIGLVLIFVAGLALVVAGLGWLLGESEVFDAGIKVLEKLGEGLGNAIGNFIEGIGRGFVSGFLVPIADEFVEFFEKIKGIPDEAFDHMWDMIGALGAVKGLELIFGEGGVFSTIRDFIFGEGFDFDDLGDTFHKLALLFGDFANDMHDVNKDDLQAGVDAAKMFTDTLNNLPRTGGIQQIWTGELSLENVAKGLKAYAPALVEYSNSMTGINQDGMYQGSKAAWRLQETLGYLSVLKQGFMPWLEGHIDLEDVAAGLNAYAPALVEYANKMAGIDLSGMEKGSWAAFRLQEVLNYLLDAYEYNAWDDLFNGDSLINLSIRLPTLGEGIKKFADAVKDISQDAINRMANIPPVVVAYGEAFKAFGESVKAMQDVDPSIISSFATELTSLDLKIVKDFVSALRNPKTETDLYSAITEFMTKILNKIREYDTQFKVSGFAMALQIKYGMLDTDSGGNSPAVTAAITMLDDVVDIMQSYYPVFKDIGYYISESLNQGMLSGKFVEGAGNLAQAGETEFRDVSHIYSPSDIWTAIGKWIPDSLGIGVEKAGTTLLSKLTGLGQDSVASFVSGFLNGESMFGIGSSESFTDLWNTYRNKYEMSKMVYDPVTGTWRKKVTTTSSKSKDTSSAIPSTSSGGSGSSKSADDELSEEEKKAKELVEAHKKIIDAANEEISSYELDFNLWAALNPNASEAEKEQKEFELLTNKIRTQTSIANEADQEYKEMQQLLGDDADLTREAASKMKQEQLELAQLLATVNETSEEINKQSKNVYEMSLDELKELKPDVMDAWVQECKAAGTAWEVQLERLKAMGLNAEDYASDAEFQAMIRDAGEKARDDFYARAYEIEKSLNVLDERIASIKAGSNDVMNNALKRNDDIDAAIKLLGMNDADVYGSGVKEGVEASQEGITTTVANSISVATNKAANSPEVQKAATDYGTKVADTTTNAIQKSTEAASTSTDLQNSSNKLGVSIMKWISDSVLSQTEVLSNALAQAISEAIEKNKSALNSLTSLGSAVSATANSSAYDRPYILENMRAEEAAKRAGLSSTSANVTSSMATSAMSRDAVNGVSSNSTTTNNFNFTQNNTSPTNISAYETYRYAMNLTSQLVAKAKTAGSIGAVVATQNKK